MRQLEEAKADSVEDGQKGKLQGIREPRDVEQMPGPVAFLDAYIILFHMYHLLN